MRIDKHTLREAPLIQNLFSNNIDFDNKVVPDAINEYNASLKYSNAKYFLNAGKLATGDNTILDITENFTYIFKGYFTSGTNDLAILSVNSRTYFGVSFVLTYVQLWINGSRTEINIGHSSGYYTFIYKKEGNIYKLYRNGILVATKTSTAVLSNNIFSFFSALNQSMITYDVGVINGTALSDAEILDIGTNSNKIKDYINLYNSNSLHFLSSEGAHLEMFDRMQGKTLTIIGASNVLRIDKEFNNLKYGFDLYTLDSNPATKLYVPLKYDGTSFGKVITGYTFVATYTQSGNEFLPCETNLLQPDIQALKDVDTSNFYFSTLGVPLEKSFDNLLTAPLYVNYVLSDGKITNLTI